MGLGFEYLDGVWEVNDTSRISGERRHMQKYILKSISILFSSRFHFTFLPTPHSCSPRRLSYRFSHNSRLFFK
jgi:hypothetical protein